MHTQHMYTRILKAPYNRDKKIHAATQTQIDASMYTHTPTYTCTCMYMFVRVPTRAVYACTQVISDLVANVTYCSQPHTFGIYMPLHMYACSYTPKIHANSI